MSSTDAPLDADLRARLLEVARRSIEHGLREGRPLPVDAADHAAPLRRSRATFTTLHRGGALRGCVGALEATRPLVEDVAESAFRAAFRDPRFGALESASWTGSRSTCRCWARWSRSTSTPARRCCARCVRASTASRSARDRRSATFLPAVWETLPDPETFLRELLRKAGLPGDHWSPGVRVSRYGVESF